MLLNSSSDDMAITITLTERCNKSGINNCKKTTYQKGIIEYYKYFV